MHDDLKQFEESLQSLVPRDMDPDRCQDIIAACEEQEQGESSAPRQGKLITVSSWVWAVAAMYMLSASMALVYNLTKTPDPPLPAPAFSSAGDHSVLEVMPNSEPSIAIGEPSLAHVPPSISEDDLYERVASREEILDRQVQGVVNVSDVGPMRQMRVRKMNHNEYRNRQTGERIIVSEPAEEVIYVRVSPF